MTTKDHKMMEQGEHSGIHNYFLISNLYMSVKWMKEGGGGRDPYKMQLGSSAPGIIGSINGNFLKNQVKSAE